MPIGSDAVSKHFGGCAVSLRPGSRLDKAVLMCCRLAQTDVVEKADRWRGGLKRIKWNSESENGSRDIDALVISRALDYRVSGEPRAIDMLPVAQQTPGQRFIAQSITAPTITRPSNPVHGTASLVIVVYPFVNQWSAREFESLLSGSKGCGRSRSITVGRHLEHRRSTLY